MSEDTPRASVESGSNDHNPGGDRKVQTVSIGADGLGNGLADDIVDALETATGNTATIERNGTTAVVSISLKDPEPEGVVTEGGPIVAKADGSVVAAPPARARGSRHHIPPQAFPSNATRRVNMATDPNKPKPQPQDDNKDETNRPQRQDEHKNSDDNEQ